MELTASVGNWVRLPAVYNLRKLHESILIRVRQIINVRSAIRDRHYGGQIGGGVIPFVYFGTLFNIDSYHRLLSEEC